MKRPNGMMLLGSIACLACGMVLYGLGKAGYVRPLTITNVLQILYVSLLGAFFAFALPGKPNTNT
jgi:hypothetical protein